MSKFGNLTTNTNFGSSDDKKRCYQYITGDGTATFDKPEGWPWTPSPSDEDKTITIKIDLKVSCKCEPEAHLGPGSGVTGVKCSGQKLSFHYSRNSTLYLCSSDPDAKLGGFTGPPCKRNTIEPLEVTLTAADLLKAASYSRDTIHGTEYCIFWSPGGPNQKLALEIEANCNAITTGNIPDGPFMTCVLDSTELSGCLERILFNCKAKDSVGKLIEGLLKRQGFSCAT